MKVSIQWLRQLVPVLQEISTSEICSKLSVSGLEVEGITPVGQGVSGVKFVEVRSKRRHPQADKLQIVEIFDGVSTSEVVCGAPNVPEPEAGFLVAWAAPGSTLPGGISVKVAEIRGVNSPGMLCSEKELGLSDNQGGLLLLPNSEGAKPGDDVLTFLQLPDDILELNVTPNRPDCLGHIGVARELVALFHERGAVLQLPAVQIKRQPGPTATVETDAACPRYHATMISSVKVAPSPTWMRLLLQRLGVRAINNVVDATNLTMLEWGQPLHAFNAITVDKSHVRVRKAADGECIVTLDGETRTLHDHDLVIADEKAPLAIAGIIGGKSSQITDSTTSLLLESAYFSPPGIRKTAKRLKLQTDASYRYERGTDPNQVDAVALSCLARITAVCDTAVVHSSIDHYPQPIAPLTLTFRPDRANQLLSLSIPLETQKSLFRSLGLSVEGEQPLLVTIPTSRPDLSREIDLIEELGRLYGYEKIPQTLQALVAQPNSSQQHTIAEKARDVCVSLGFSEIQSLPMVSAKWNATFSSSDGPQTQPLTLQNPLREELGALRTKLSNGVLEALRHNHSHGLRELRLFEVAETFSRENGEPLEKTCVALAMTGNREAWLKTNKDDALTVFDLKGKVEELLRELGFEVVPRLSQQSHAGATPVSFEATSSLPWLHPGLSAKIVQAETKEVIGELGELHPALRDSLDLGPVFLAEFVLPETKVPHARFTGWSKFPEMTRDLSFFAPINLPLSTLAQALRTCAQPLLSDIHVLDDYRDAERVPAQKKSLLLSLTYRSTEKTLTESEVQAAHDALVQHLVSTFALELR